MNTLPFVSISTVKQDIATVVAMTKEERAELADKLIDLIRTSSSEVTAEVHAQLMDNIAEIREALIELFDWIKPETPGLHVFIEMYKLVEKKTNI